jgi:general secretion pathway protein B
MSYILDALRKADADRERGAMPTLHSHPEHGGRPADARAAAVATGRAAWSRPALVVAALLLLTLGGLAARWLKDDSPPLAAPPPQIAPAALPTPVPVPLAQPRPAPLTPTLIAPPPAPVETAALAPAVATKPAIPKLADLPEATRKALPALTTSGAMYSDTPANRMLIVNGQLLHEGDKITPDLTLEQIELKSAVLSHKGLRFRINY